MGLGRGKEGKQGGAAGDGGGFLFACLSAFGGDPGSPQEGRRETDSFSLVLSVLAWLVRPPPG